ncbi:hypothetical protein BV22DRAFT_650960 [Leucogyrophana mollusca]|uniref:Uncharacterized protein n=1 Tax=Leucogyrophana mollusca TaxID=85980 RepID=A0ACB8BAC3_9AGAM|nr:hypothetical protein BV22DRAFT_650960 [Leucogyrophana mollusca]
MLGVRSRGRSDLPHAIMARISVAKYALYVTQTGLADSYLVWRTYVVPGTKARYAAAVLWACAVVAVGATAISLFSGSGGEEVFDTSAFRWIAAFYGLTLATHFTGTVILVSHIAHHVVQAKCILGHRGGPYFYIMRVLVEAHMVYSCVVLPAFVCFLCKILPFYIIADLAVPLVSIVHFMTIIRRRSAQSHTISERHSTPISFEARDRSSTSKYRWTDYCEEVGTSELDISTYTYALPTDNMI